MTRIRTATAVLLLALTLVGCAGIPRSGDVGVGQPDTSDQDFEYDFLPSGPADGASQAEILNGFIDAASSPQGNYKVAREFLSTGADWVPGEHVTVDQGQRQQVQQNDSTIRLSITPTAEIDETGVYTEVASAAQLTLDYGFVLEQGEWRISSPPSGLVIDTTTFGQVFSTHALYFFDPTLSFLVPDLRWFASRADTSTSTTIVTELLRGPSPWLKDSGAVVSAFPAGTALAAESVPIEEREAVVDLNSAALDADDRARQLMRLQLVRSLTNVSNVTGVTISVEQNPLDVSTAATNLPAVPRVDARALVVSEADGLGFLSGSDVTRIAALSDDVVALAPTAVTVGAEQKTAAVLAADGVHLVASTGDSALLDGRPGLIAPSMDPLGYVWSVPGGAPGQLVAYTPDGSQAVQVATTWPEADRIASFSVSRDGTRALALVSDGTQSILLVAGITRGANGTPTAVGEPVVLASLLGEPVAAAWVDEVDAVSVVRSSTGDDTVRQHQLGGKRTSLGTTTDVTAIAAGNATSQIRVLSSGGELRQQRGSAWQATATGISVLGTQTGVPN
ncbi:GerMN domain-containing protein [Microbacteriaceae bacterium VKM Ac-2854]|nr:GerMN domain-containing protein [Microbacteriaceae bacterium VKM Ac-2854]